MNHKDVNLFTGTGLKEEEISKIVAVGDKDLLINNCLAFLSFSLRPQVRIRLHSSLCALILPHGLKEKYGEILSCYL